MSKRSLILRWLGRCLLTDLVQVAVGLMETAEPRVRELVKSAERCQSMPDSLQIGSAHGAGSVCGKGCGVVPSPTDFTAGHVHASKEVFQGEVIAAGFECADEIEVAAFEESCMLWFTQQPQDRGRTTFSFA